MAKKTWSEVERKGPTFVEAVEQHPLDKEYESVKHGQTKDCKGKRMTEAIRVQFYNVVFRPDCTPNIGFSFFVDQWQVAGDVQAMSVPNAVRPSSTPPVSRLHRVLGRALQRVSAWSAFREAPPGHLEPPRKSSGRPNKTDTPGRKGHHKTGSSRCTENRRSSLNLHRCCMMLQMFAAKQSTSITDIL